MCRLDPRTGIPTIILRPVMILSEEELAAIRQDEAELGRLRGAAPRRDSVGPWSRVWPGLVESGPNDVGSEARGAQYSPLITKYEPRIVPASFDFCRANLNEPSSAGTSIPSESLNPTARFFGSSSGYRTLIESPFS